MNESSLQVKFQSPHRTFFLGYKPCRVGVVSRSDEQMVDRQYRDATTESYSRDVIF